MSLRIISGSSGQGKTKRLIDEVIRLSGEHPEQKYYIIVPEQFSLEMQTKLVESHPEHGYFNIDVISFYRLAYRVFDECNFKPKDILEDLGVSLILRRILAEHEEEFPYFKKSIRKAGFVDELKSMLMEFICYDITWNQLQELNGELEGYPILQTKCQELGKIYEYFEQATENTFMVAEQILDVLSTMVPVSEMLREGIFYFDGFTGFTPVQLRFLRELLKVSAQVNISVTMEGNPFILNIGSQAVKEGEELFFFSEKTVRSLAKICQEAGVEMEEPSILAADIPPRYDNEELIFLERHLFRAAKKSYDKALEHIHLTVCENQDMEVEYVIHKIEQMVRTQGYRYRDFAILTGNVGEYASSFRRKADILHIPLFEDVKRRVSYHPGVETIRAIFHMAVMDYSYESVFRYLKSGMSDFTDEETDFLENYVIWAGIRGYSMWKKPFSRRMGRIVEEKADTLQKLREQFLLETEECVNILKDKKQNVRSKMTALYEYMCRLDYAGKLNVLADAAEEEGDYVKEKEYRQLFTLILDLFDKIVGIFGEEYISVDELTEIMEAGLDSLELGTLPLSMDQLILGDLKRTRLPEIKVLFIVGMNEGKIPPVLEDGGIIHDEEKQVLEQCGITLSLPLQEQSLEDEFYMYLAFSKPKRELYFTYAQQGNGDGALSPSPLLKDCIRLFPMLKERSYPGEEKRYYFNLEDSRELLMEGLREMQEGNTVSGPFRMLLRYWYDKEELRPELFKLWVQTGAVFKQKKLPEELMRELFGNELMGSVTRLERYAACPYQYYCIYGLELREREEYRVRPMDLGNLFHYALEKFSTHLKESEYTWKNIPDSVADEWIEQAVETAATEEIKDVLQGSARNAYKLQVVTRILKRTVRVVRVHLENSSMEPDRFELHFGKMDHLHAVHIPLKNGNRMVLEGFIDRVDVCEEENRILLRIIDYKSGMQSFDMNNVYYGLQMQLVIYMDVALEKYEKETGKEAVPAGMYYYQLKDPIMKTGDRGEKDLKKNFRMSGYTNSESEILRKLENNQGEFISSSVRLTKTGMPYNNSPVMNTGDFHRLGAYMRRKITEMGEAIYAGDIEASPYRMDKETACDYCPYRSVCGFDANLWQYTYRELKKQSAKEALEQIRGQVD